MYSVTLPHKITISRKTTGKDASAKLKHCGEPRTYKGHRSRIPGKTDEVASIFENGYGVMVWSIHHHTCTSYVERVSRIDSEGGGGGEGTWGGPRRGGHNTFLLTLA